MGRAEHAIGQDSISIMKFDGPVPKEHYRPPTRDKILNLRERRPQIQGVILIDEDDPNRFGTAPSLG